MRNLISIGIIPEAFYNFNYHQHSIWEMVYYIQGTGIITVGDVDIPFEPGVVVCLPPDIPHRERSESGYRNIYFTVQSFEGLNVNLPRFMDNDNKDYYNILIQLYNIFHLKPQNWRALSESLLDVLYQYMVSWSLKKRKHPLVEKFETELISNISNKNFSIEKAMKEIPLTEDHFRKIYKSETGKTPLQYLTEKRIEYAKNLLRNRRLEYIKVSEVSELVGIEDPYYFSKVFKKITGMSPSTYVKEHTDF